MYSKKMHHNRQFGSWVGKAGDDTLTVLGTTLVRTDWQGNVVTVTSFETTIQAVLWTERHCL